MNQKAKTLVNEQAKNDPDFRAKIKGTQLEEFVVLNAENFENHLQVNGILGKGTFGIVYLAQDIYTGGDSQLCKKYAVKSVQKESEQCKL